MKNLAKIGMIRLGILILSIVFIYACKAEPDYKVTRQQVMDLHDKLMIDGEIAIRNKMALDTLAIKDLSDLRTKQPSIDTAKEKKLILELIGRLNAADEHMMDWMNKFQPDIDGKNNAQAVTYFNAEKVKLVKMDSLYKVVIRDSDDYLKKFNLEDHPSDDGHDHSKH